MSLEGKGELWDDDTSGQTLPLSSVSNQTSPLYGERTGKSEHPSSASGRALAGHQLHKSLTARTLTGLVNASFLPAAKPLCGISAGVFPQYRALHFPSHGAFAFSHPSAFIVLRNREAGSWTAWAGVSEQAPSRCLCSQTRLALTAFPAGLSCVRAGCRQSLWAAPCLQCCLFGAAAPRGLRVGLVLGTG